jgi:6-phosphofructokinase
MGRASGFVTAHATLASLSPVDVCLIPEGTTRSFASPIAFAEGVWFCRTVKFDKDRLVDYVIQVTEKTGSLWLRRVISVTHVGDVVVALAATI